MPSTNMKNSKALPNDVNEMFEHFSATEIVEFFEMLDLMLVNEGVKRSMSQDFNFRYEFTIYLLKRAIRALEPPQPTHPTCPSAN